MKERSQLACLVLVFFFSVSGFTQDWKNEKSWKKFGHRWAAANDGQNNLSALYDLAYPDWTKKILLGLVGENISKEEVAKKILASKNMPETDQVEADNALKDLGKMRETNLGGLPENWWRFIDWPFRSFTAAPPETFHLSDFDAAGELAKNPKLAKVVTDAKNAMDEVEGAGMGATLLQGFEFNRGKDGVYLISWGVPAQFKIKTSGPRKIVDLKNMKWAFNQSVKIFVVKEVLLELSSLAGPTITGALIGVALDRFFHFYENMILTQQNMLLEVLTTLERKEPHFGNISISPEDRLTAVYALVFAQASIETKWQLKFIWKDPKKEWARMTKLNLDFQKANMKWLTDHGAVVSNLNSRFLWSVDPKLNKNLVALASRNPHKKKGPTAAVNYQSPESIYKNRLYEEIATTAVVFGTFFAPYGGAVARTFYKHYIEQPIDTDKVWEGRLLVDLEEIQTTTKTDRTFEFGILDHQRINPLVATRVETRKLIDERLKMIGL